MMRILAALLFLALSASAAPAQEGIAAPGIAGPPGAAGPAGAAGPRGPVGDFLPNGNGSTPVPDPTKLTQEAVDRAVAQLSAIFAVQLAAITDRMNRLGLAITASGTEANESIGAAIANLQALMQEKFKGVADQFVGRDVALAAALLAQKTAVDDQNKSNALSISKSDAAVAKQIDTIAASSEAKSAALNEKVDDLRTRLQAIESRAVGVNDNRADNGALFGYVVGGFGVLAALFGFWTGMRPAPAPARGRAG